MSLTRRAFLGAIAAGVALGLTPRLPEPRFRDEFSAVSWHRLWASSQKRQGIETPPCNGEHELVFLENEDGSYDPIGRCWKCGEDHPAPPIDPTQPVGWDVAVAEYVAEPTHYEAIRETYLR